jgi:neutral trehalase
MDYHPIKNCQTSILSLPHLQSIAYQPLNKLADQIPSRWLNLNHPIYKKTGKIIEKSNVLHQTEGGGGNCPSQHGFRWTNEVYLKLIDRETLIRQNYLTFSNK